MSRTGSRPFFPFLGIGVPLYPLKTKKGTLFVPRLLPGLGVPGCLLHTRGRERGGCA